VSYGKPPTEVGKIDVHCDEFMSWLYCPVWMPDQQHWAFPPNLRWARTIVDRAALHWLDTIDSLLDTYVYLTAKHGYATPDNPLNRPGWHCDGFGTEDINYVWWEGAGSQFMVGDLGLEVSSDHVESMRQFDFRAVLWLAGTHYGRMPTEEPNLAIRSYPERTLLRLDPFVVHSTPELEHGQMRTFVKVSFSKHRYNLLGNSHNFGFDYDWKMWPREVLRNDPTYGETDFYLEEKR
jgi:hypothetical protein